MVCRYETAGDSSAHWEKKKTVNYSFVWIHSYSAEGCFQPRAPWSSCVCSSFFFYSKSSTSGAIDISIDPRSISWQFLLREVRSTSWPNRHPVCDGGTVWRCEAKAANALRRDFPSAINGKGDSVASQSRARLVARGEFCRETRRAFPPRVAINGFARIFSLARAAIGRIFGLASARTIRNVTFSTKSNFGLRARAPPDLNCGLIRISRCRRTSCEENTGQIRGIT